MAHHGIQVFLQNGDRNVEEFKNIYLSRHEIFDGYLRSCLVSMEPDTPFKVAVRFTQDFQRFTEDGVLVNVACENVSQSFWIDYRLRHIDNYSLSAFTRWSSPAGNATKRLTALQVPTPDQTCNATAADWMVSDDFSAGEGRISVSIQRGRLNDFRDESTAYRWVDTDPPTATRTDLLEQPRIVRPEWFRPLKSDNGKEYLFEFRNIVTASKDGLTRFQPGDERDPYFDIDLVDSESDTSVLETSDREFDTSDEDDDRWPKSSYGDSDDSIEVPATRPSQKRSMPDADSNTRLKRTRNDESSPTMAVALRVEQEALRRVSNNHSRDEKSHAVLEEIEQKTQKASPAFSEGVPILTAPRDSYVSGQTAAPVTIANHSTLRTPDVGPAQPPTNFEPRTEYEQVTTPAPAMALGTHPSTSGQAAIGEDLSADNVEDLEDQLETVQLEKNAVKLRMAIRAAKKKKATND